MCFVWISEQTAIISLYNINWLVFIIETECVYCAVRTVSLKTVMVNLCFGPVSNPSKSVWIFGQKSVTRTGFSSSIYVPSCQCHSIPLHQNSTLTFIDVFLLPEEQMGEAWEPSKTQCYSGNNGRKIHTVTLTRILVRWGAPRLTAAKVRSLNGFRHKTNWQTDIQS